MPPCAGSESVPLKAIPGLPTSAIVTALLKEAVGLPYSSTASTASPNGLPASIVIGGCSATIKPEAGPAVTAMGFVSAGVSLPLPA